MIVCLILPVPLQVHDSGVKPGVILTASCSFTSIYWYFTPVFGSLPLLCQAFWSTNARDKWLQMLKAIGTPCGVARQRLPASNQRRNCFKAKLSEGWVKQEMFSTVPLNLIVPGRTRIHPYSKNLHSIDALGHVCHSVVASKIDWWCLGLIHHFGSLFDWRWTPRAPALESEILGSVFVKQNLSCLHINTMFIEIAPCPQHVKRSGPTMWWHRVRSAFFRLFLHSADRSRSIAWTLWGAVSSSHPLKPLSCCRGIRPTAQGTKSCGGAVLQWTVWGFRLPGSAASGGLPFVR